MEENSTEKIQFLLKIDEFAVDYIPENTRRFYIEKLETEIAKLLKLPKPTDDQISICCYSLVKNWLLSSTSEFMQAHKNELFVLLYAVVMLAAKENHSLLSILSGETEFCSFLCNELEDNIRTEKHYKTVLNILLAFLKVKSNNGKAGPSEQIIKSLFFALEHVRLPNERRDIIDALKTQYQFSSLPTRQVLEKMLEKGMASGFERKAAALEAAAPLGEMLAADLRSKVLQSSLELCRAKAPAATRNRAYNALETLASCGCLEWDQCKQALDDVIELGEGSVFVDASRDELLKAYADCLAAVLIRAYSLNASKTKQQVPAVIGLMLEIFSFAEGKSDGGRGKIAERAIGQVIEKCCDAYFLSELDSGSTAGITELLLGIELGDDNESASGVTNLERIFSLLSHSLGDRFHASRRHVLAVIEKFIFKISDAGLTMSPLYNKYLITFFRKVEGGIGGEDFDKEDEPAGEMDVEKPAEPVREKANIEHSVYRDFLGTVVHNCNLAYFLSHALRIPENRKFLEKDLTKQLRF